GLESVFIWCKINKATVIHCCSRNFTISSRALFADENAPLHSVLQENPHEKEVRIKQNTGC
ncbi:MAG: hypothetical protein E7H99_17310, partial [Citrobacter freundii]|nr:hypothetical protein [Citrobacter freundii]